MDRPPPSQEDQREVRHEQRGLGLEALAPGDDRREAPLTVLQFCSARSATYGAVASMMSLSRELRAQGQVVLFGTFSGRGLGSFTREHGYPTFEFAVRAKIDPLAVLGLARFLRRSGVDVVHTHLSTSTVNGSLAARLVRVPSVATVHGLSGKLSFLAADRLIAVSACVRDHMIQQGVDGSRISIVPNGIAPQILESGWRASVRAELAIPEEAPVFGTVARLTPLKGVAHAVRGFQRVSQKRPDAHFVIVGAGEEEGRLRDLARDSAVGSRTHFLGYREDVPRVLSSLDVFVFPTLREAMGISVVEAMAVGLPVVASRTGGVPEVVTAETGILVPPSDPVSLADAMLALISDPSRLARMSEAARDRAASEFSVQRMASRTLDVYRRALQIRA